MDELVRVTVLIPRIHLADLYQWSAHSVWEFERESQPRDWTNQDQEETIKLARDIYWNVTDGAKKFLDWLIDHPNAEVESEKLVTELGFTTAARLNGTLSSIARGANRNAMPLPYIYDKESSIFIMDEEVAQVFRSAREQGKMRPIRDVLEELRLKNMKGGSKAKGTS